MTDKGEILGAVTAANRGYAGLAEWMEKAETVWRKNASDSTKISFTEQIDFYRKLSSQFPISPIRVVYAASGTNPAACVLRHTEAVLEHKLYGGAVSSLDEGAYLTAIINSETARMRVEHLQSKGQWGARDFDKVIFNLSIPRFDDKRSLHHDLAAAARRAEAIAAAVDVPQTAAFQRARSMVRNALRDAGVAQEIDRLVARLLDGG